ncbi:hypothetical protein [Pseudomonas viridiflava]|uniref:hypothetical protein n=1 Tax=Pseudomonas viridiflava TaxID=33069 RepID=UPI001BCDAD8C|nr:hypothetical protein [Pseudomonas viridiflava]QVI84693.1 hypothetical protein KHW14_20590 [Pseudomonas viridiflava]
MEVVLLAYITFNRIGSASSGGGFSNGQHRQRKFSVEAATKDRDTLRSLVIEIAEDNREAPGSLEALSLKREDHRGVEYVFNIHGRNTFTDPHTSSASFNLHSKPMENAIN